MYFQKLPYFIIIYTTVFYKKIKTFSDNISVYLCNNSTAPSF